MATKVVCQDREAEARRCRQLAGRAESSPVIEQLNRSESGAFSHTAISRCARLSAGRERQSVMLTTLLIIVASAVAGMIVNHVHPEYRKW
jgi:fructose-1,6-bisphosphatase/sedoheptulose 1,7-bisphosphatase-like protein